MLTVSNDEKRKKIKNRGKTEDQNAIMQGWIGTEAERKKDSDKKDSDKGAQANKKKESSEEDQRNKRPPDPDEKEEHGNAKRRRKT